MTLGAWANRLEHRPVLQVSGMCFCGLPLAASCHFEAPNQGDTGEGGDLEGDARRLAPAQVARDGVDGQDVGEVPVEVKSARQGVGDGAVPSPHLLTIDRASLVASVDLALSEFFNMEIDLIGGWGLALSVTRHEVAEAVVRHAVEPIVARTPWEAP